MTTARRGLVDRRDEASRTARRPATLGALPTSAGRLRDNLAAATYLAVITPEARGDYSGRTVTETGRLETFADGVFAIAITLLVLAIRLPTPDEDLGAALLRQWPEFAGYLVSFLTIGIMWVQHHRLLTLIQRRTARSL